MDVIAIRGARTHNLKNVSVDLPRGRYIVFTGVSGSGKSSLAFDTLYAEGERRYVESLSAYARQFLERLPRPDVDEIRGLPPAIAIDQKTTQGGARSTVGTSTEISDYLRLLFARTGDLYCPAHHLRLEAQSVAFPELKPGRRYRVAMGDYIFKTYSGLDYTDGAPTGTLLTDVLDSYLRARSPLAPDNEPRQRIE